MSELLKERNERLALIEAIEKSLDARLIVYFLADAPLAGAQIAEDATREMYRHLRRLGKQKRLALYLYSIGGVMEAPWKLVTMLREYCDAFEVVVPYKAYSAATMIAIGADKIHLSPKAELGPIDPSLVGVPQTPGGGLRLDELGVEDVSSYLRFVKDRAHLTDQAAVSSLVAQLAQHLTPPLLGRLERVSSHIRVVGHDLLALHNPPLPEGTINRITEVLIEKIYVHGHGISRRQAQQIGLDVAFTEGAQDDDIWRLYELYEARLRMEDTKEPEAYFPAKSDEFVRPDTTVGCIESGVGLSSCVGDLIAKRTRKMPSQINVNVNLTLNLPPNLQPAQLPEAVQQAIQQLLQQGVQQLQQMVNEQVAAQAPVDRIAATLRGACWKRNF